MKIDGRRVASDVLGKLKVVLGRFVPPPALGIVVVGDDPVIERFVRIKKRAGEEIGVPIREFRFSKEITTEELRREVLACVSSNERLSGLIVQLPLPEHIDTTVILDLIPAELDVDVLAQNSMARFRSGTLPVLPPVVGAIQEILEREKFDVEGKDVLVIGRGKLVGAPAAIFFQHNGAHVTMIGRGVTRIEDLTKEADIIISGAGVPGLLRPEMLRPGVVLIDAGTSEQAGKLAGDADPRCEEVASIFTPVPGGVGPIAVSMIFKNLMVLASHRESARFA